MGKVIGIDLGTTFSAVAFVNQHGQPEIIANREGENITPSVVLFDGEAPIAGSIAKRSAAASPLNVAQFVKRQMGDPAWRFRTESGEKYSPEEISAIILRRLKEDAETFLGEPVRDAVITVPAYFDDAQRKATQDAGKIAGLNVRRVINEPTAAALAYGLEKSTRAETVLVYDLGGGTFDVTIMKVDRSDIQVVATGGDRNLGGFDWDNRVMTHLNEEFRRQGGLDLFDDPALEQDLRDKAEIAKKTLSTRDKTNVFLSGGGKNISVPIHLDKFNELTESLMKRTGHIMEGVREDAGLEWSEIDKVLLVGGSTRMKAVAALVERITGKKPSMELHPDLVVALGAAIQGAVLQAQQGEATPELASRFSIVEIQDVCSHSMGVIALNDSGKEFNSIIIRNGSRIPCKVSEQYSTVRDKQTGIEVQVTETEREEEDPQRVKIIAEQPLKIPPYPQGAPIEVTFAYDVDQTVHVSVKDLTANRDLGDFVVPRKRNMTGQQVDEASNKLARKSIG